MFKPLHSFAKVSLGYKSLQNNFFYVNKATIATYGIEGKFLIPMLMLRDLDPANYKQKPTPSLWLFSCKEKQGDLRGTGAWRYIEAMADRAAADRKQSGKNLTIREALDAQSGGLWYAPKAKPAFHHIWLRKAVNTIYAPFLFEKAALIDQRLNSISPLEGIEWKELGAALTSSLFTYSLEINGAASMGAGALEAPTTKLRDYPVLDIMALKPTGRKRLVSLAENVWLNEPPIDWGSEHWQPGKHLRALDEWILKTAGESVSVDQMYADIRATCQSRILVAEDKTKKSKKQESDSIGSVASAIVRSVEPRLKTKNFPDDFAKGVKLDLPLIFDRGSLKEIAIGKLLDSYELEVRTKGGLTVYAATHPSSVAEAIIRAILLGRSTFSVSTDRKAMDQALDKFFEWVLEAEEEIKSAVNESAFGTGYEDALKKEVYSRLGIHPLTGAKELPAQISL
ncbi:MAG TPA: hypothetical protein VK181_01045 [Rhizobium sp.]|nr:hypothetical protein [Rhizobium sp.]